MKSVINLKKNKKGLSDVVTTLIIILLVPLALKGVRYKPVSANTALTRNLLIFGLGGIIIPFVGIKLIDILINL